MTFVIGDIVYVTKANSAQRDHRGLVCYADSRYVYTADFGTTDKALSPPQARKWANGDVSKVAPSPPIVTPPPPSASKIVGGCLSELEPSFVVDLGIKSMRVEGFKASDFVRTDGKYTNVPVLPLVNDYNVDPTKVDNWIAAAKSAVPYASHGIIEIGNESWWPYHDRPALNGKSPESRPGDWAKMWSAVVDALPNIRIIVPVGLKSANSVDWIAGANAAVPGIFKKVHGIAVHPYGPIDNIIDLWHYPGVVTAVRQALASVGATNVPQYWTEIGTKAIDSSGRSTTAIQAAAVTRYFLDMKSASDVMGLWYYNGRDWQVPNPSADNAWALVDEKGKPRPAYAAFRAGVATIKA